MHEEYCKITDRPGYGAVLLIFCIGDEPKSGLARDLGDCYNPGMCLLALPVIEAIHQMRSTFSLFTYNDLLKCKFRQMDTSSFFF